MKKVLLKKHNRIDGNAGDIVEVSDDRAAFLFEFGLAEPAIEAKAEKPEEKPVTRRTTRTKK